MLLFWRHCYEGVSIGDLTKAIGVAQPGLYAASGSKAGPDQQALTRYGETLGRLDVAGIGAAASLPNAARVLLEGAVVTVTHRERERGCVISGGLISGGLLAWHLAIPPSLATPPSGGTRCAPRSRGRSRPSRVTRFRTWPP